MTFEMIPAYVSDALSALAERGYEAYLVGGCVRDILRGVEPHDYDLTTSALPEQVKSVFAREKVVETGIKHGTVTVVTDGGTLEITTFRTECGYSDNRHPDRVSFAKTLAEDLCRRDFTVNAMAWSKKAGLTDLYGGREDLRNGVIRCVGDPGERFREDALRLLRAVRFASQLDFAIEPKTKRAIGAHRDLLANVSAERVFEELKKLLCGKGVARVLAEERDLLAVVIPELKPCFDFPQRSAYHIYDVYTHTVKVVEAAPPDPVLRFAALLHDAAKPLCCVKEGEITHFKGHPEQSARIAESVLKRLRADRATTDAVVSLIRHHDDYAALGREAMPRLLSQMPPERAFALFDFMEADNRAKSARGPEFLPAIENGRALLRELLNTGFPLSVRDLNVSGEDLLAVGVPAGKPVGEMLSKMLVAVQEEKVENDRNSLLEFARDRIDKRL